MWTILKFSSVETNFMFSAKQPLLFSPKIYRLHCALLYDLSLLIISYGVLRLGLGFETCLETRFLESRSRSRRSQVSSRSLSRRIRSRSRALSLETLHRWFLWSFARSSSL